MKAIEIPEEGDKIIILDIIYIYKGITEEGYHLFECEENDRFTCDNEAFYNQYYIFVPKTIN